MQEAAEELRSTMKSKLHILVLVFAYALAALSVAAGIPKVLQMPQELGFLSALGFSALAVSILGVTQLGGAVLLLRERTRVAGAVLAGLAILVSSVALYSGGNTSFALVSLVPFTVSIFVLYSARTTPGDSAAE